MKKKIAVVLVTLMVLVALFYAGRKLTIHALASIDLNVRPFVYTVTHYAIQNGVEVLTAKETVARTRSGARVHTGTAYSSNGSTLNMRKIEAPDGVAMVADNLRAKSTGHRPDMTLASSKKQLLTQPADCVEPTPAGMKSFEKLESEDVMFGQRVNRISVTGDTYRMTHWRMPDFNCQPVQILMEENVNGKWQVKLGSTLTSFVETDPDPSLFSGYDGYREMAPSGVVKEYIKQKTGKDYPGNSKQDQQMDKTYTDWNK